MEGNFHYFKASDGTDIEYVDVGKGKPLVYVHGYAGSAEGQLPLFELLKDKFRCISFTERGFAGPSGIGKGTPARGELTLAQAAKDAKEFIEFLGLDKVILLGYSMGTHILFTYVNLYGCTHIERAIIGDMTPKLINDDTWKHGLYQGHYTRDRYEKDLELMEKNYAEFNGYFMYQAIFPHTAQEDRDYIFTDEHKAALAKFSQASGMPLDTLLSPPKSMWPVFTAYWKAMGEADFRDMLNKITVPTALMCAVPGSIYDISTAEYLNQHIPHSKLYPIQDSTHVTLAFAKIKETAQLIEDFSVWK